MGISDAILLFHYLHVMVFITISGDVAHLHHQCYFILEVVILLSYCILFNEIISIKL